MSAELVRRRLSRKFAFQIRCFWEVSTQFIVGLKRLMLNACSSPFPRCVAPSLPLDLKLLEIEGSNERVGEWNRPKFRQVQEVLQAAVPHRGVIKG
jgi:hypothetical protein